MKEEDEEEVQVQEIVIENTNLITETSVVTEMVTEAVMVPGTVEDLEKEQQPKEQPEKAQRLDDEGQYVLISSSNVEADPGEFKEFSKETSTTEGETTQVTAALQLMVDDPKDETKEMTET